MIVRIEVADIEGVVQVVTVKRTETVDVAHALKVLAGLNDAVPEEQ